MTRFFLPHVRNICLGLFSLAFLASGALAQSTVSVIGPITPGDCAVFNSTTVLKDSGGTGCTGSGSGIPGGTNGQIQYNNSGNFGGFTANGDATINTGTGAVNVTHFAVNALSNATVAPSGTIPASALGYTPLGLVVNSTSDNAAESGFTPGQNLPSLLYLEQNFGGSNINNGRNALSVLLNMTAASNASNAYKFYVGSVFQSQSSVNDGGTGGTPVGVLEGATAVGFLKTGATNWLANFGAEFAVSDQTGSSSKQKAALRLTEWPSDAVAGSSVDAFLAMSSDTGAPGLTQGIMIDNSSGATPLNSSATVLKIGSAMNITTGLDFNNATISGNVLQWKNGASTFSLGGNGSAALNFIQTGNLNFFSGGVTVGTCTGLGAGGTCALNTGSSPDVGKITLTTGTAPSNAGAVTLTFGAALGSDDTSCRYTIQDGNAAWPVVTTTQAQVSSTTAATFIWNAASALTASKTYQIEYQCFGM